MVKRFIQAPSRRCADIPSLPPPGVRKRSYALFDNQGDIGKTLLAFATKLPLAVLWVLNLFKMLNPGGRTASQRSQNRGEAMIILLILTPIIGALVVDRSGSFFKPSDWIRGRRVDAGIRDHLR